MVSGSWIGFRDNFRGDQGTERITLLVFFLMFALRARERSVVGLYEGTLLVTQFRLKQSCEQK